MPDELCRLLCPAFCTLQERPAAFAGIQQPEHVPSVDIQDLMLEAVEVETSKRAGIRLGIQARFSSPSSTRAAGCSSCSSRRHGTALRQTTATCLNHVLRILGHGINLEERHALKVLCRHQHL